MKIMVSACLLGQNCKYNGGNNYSEKVAEVIAETLGCKTTSVSVAIKDIPEENWKEQVWDKSIVPDDQYLYKRPEYTCE
ncbi:MAG: tautomerase family protein [Butyrivibrio sp.]|nr:tautomerase family protein [Butyrivibrio sp.]